MDRTGPNDLVCGAYDLKDFSSLLSIASSRYNMPEYTFNLNLVNMVLQKLWVSGFAYLWQHATGCLLKYIGQVRRGIPST